MMRLSANAYYEDDRLPSVELCLDELFFVSELLDVLLGTKKRWYEKGYSRKQALEHVVFNHDKAEPKVVERWSSRINKEYPLIIDGVWDGEVDSKICSINYIKKHVDNIKKTNLDISITCGETEVSTNKVVGFLTSLVNNKEHMYASINTNGYWNNDENVFPDRIPVGWMIYIPVVLLPELIPEAGRVVPVVAAGKQKGTIVVSTTDIFDGRNKEHISKANDMEIKLLDLGLLPLMTEL
ncbi:immunity 52 family protein [Enterobacter cloacae complex sp. ECC445]|uniref:Imm52 family immunity protein n=1 Tax=Enterobacter cloacae complex TaxID=354276 RepID=UPI00097BC417|nr:MULTISPECIES: Imm52 family immunity protein [Enterobacter cloacae complex]MBT1935481.1 immunity 52 family protein [Enterobacter chengduensis]MBT1963935.1 immunity 52 family protein [Enterobacter chengduensis]MCG0457408.1 immunity 52 family protein [Enterobacter cloacae complex sp. ECC445]MCK6820253.1 immunity 52 family protein [Enterobacter chengduensis]MCK7170820.1 immunity 52 family protein [Enterobacter chengduensis]